MLNDKYCLVNCPGPSLLLNETIKTDHFFTWGRRFAWSPGIHSVLSARAPVNCYNLWDWPIDVVRDTPQSPGLIKTITSQFFGEPCTDESNIVWLSSLTMLTLLLSWAAFMIFLQVRSMVRYLFPSTGSWRLISSELKIGSMYSHDRWQMSHSSNTSYQQNTTETQRLLVIVFGKDTYIQIKQTIQK